jgi:hypothetical protein
MLKTNRQYWWRGAFGLTVGGMTNLTAATVVRADRRVGRHCGIPRQALDSRTLIQPSTSVFWFAMTTHTRIKASPNAIELMLVITRYPVSSRFSRERIIRVER